MAGEDAAESRRTRLSRRQEEVLGLVAAGKSNAEIATALGISLDGAKWHLREVFAKLGVDNREDAVMEWRRRAGPRAKFRSMLVALTPTGVAKAVGLAGAVTVSTAATLGILVWVGIGNPPRDAVRGNSESPGGAGVIIAAGQPDATATTFPLWGSATKVPRSPTVTPTPTSTVAGTIYEPNRSLPIPAECNSNLVEAIVNRFYGAWNDGDAEAMFDLVSDPGGGGVWFDMGYDPLLYAKDQLAVIAGIRTLDDAQALVARYEGTRWTFVGRPFGSFENTLPGRIGVRMMWRLSGPPLTALGYESLTGMGKLGVRCSTGTYFGVMSRPTLHPVQ
jgi:DNA-binding CsgD family transcriptional regulator